MPWDFPKAWIKSPSLTAGQPMTRRLSATSRAALGLNCSM